jgi:pyrimidine-nucleoside phosphorylase
MPAHVILKKRQGEVLSEPEIRHFIDGLTKGTVPEYQMSALAMAICF